MTAFLHFNDQDSEDPLANLLLSLAILFTIDDRGMARLQDANAVKMASRRYEDVLGRYLTHSYGPDVARRKVLSLGAFRDLSRQYHNVHVYRAYSKQ